MTNPVLPCRINELFPSPARHCLSLNGKWHFVTDPLRRLTARQAALKVVKFKFKLKVPGCWEAQGVGGAGLLTRTPYSTNWFKGTYRGLGWYLKRFDYVAFSPGNRIWLKMGVVHGSATIYLNGKKIGGLFRSIGAYRFDITDECKPRGNVLIIAVDNDFASCGGAGDAMGVIGGLTQGVEIEQTAPAWIAAVHVTGDVQRQAATGRIKIVGADKEVQYKIKLTARLISGRAVKQTIDLNIQPPVKNGAVELPFALPMPKAALWSPKTPALYALTIQLLCNDAGIDEYTTRFGFRSISVQGTRIYLNGRPFFMAGCGTMTHTPQTVCPTTDRTALRREFRRMKAYGFVYARYHTETPYDELFDAADEAGIMIQPENRPYSGQSNEPVQAGGEIEFKAGMEHETDAETHWHIRETVAIYKHFGHHPSLAVYCMGNEYYDNKLTTRRQWYKAVKAMDSTRLAISADGQCHYHAGADDYVAGFLSAPDILRKKPVVLHEFVSSPTLPDAREASRFNGGMLMPESLRQYLAWARRNGIGYAQLRKLSVASHKLQENNLKYSIEKARAIPGIQGYGIWRYRDFWQFPTRVGIVTVHGVDKDRTSADLRAYNSQTVLISNLARDNMEINGMPAGRHLEVYGSHQVESVCRCGASMALTLYLSHYGAETVRNGWLNWRVVCGATALAQGRLRAPECRSGATARCGTVRWKIPDKNTPCEARLMVELDSSVAKTANTWSLWAFPREMPQDGRDLACYEPTGSYFPLDPDMHRITDGNDLSRLGKNTIIITDSLFRDGIPEFLGKGGKALLVSARDFPNQALVAHPGWWSAGPHRFTGAVLKKHPVFQRWPGAGFADWPFYRFFMPKEALEFPEKLEGEIIPTTVVPVFEQKPFAHDAIAYGVRGVQEGWTSPIQHFQFGWMPYLFEMRIGAGRVFACMLRLRNDPLVGNWLAKSILTYMRSSAFQPKARTDWRQLRRFRQRNLAGNCPIYCRRSDAKTDQIFIHGLRRKNGFKMIANLPTSQDTKPINIGRCCPPAYPKTVWIDLGARQRIGKVLLTNIPDGNARHTRVSIGNDVHEMAPLGTQCFPRNKSIKLEFAGKIPAARFVCIELMDSYQNGGKIANNKLLLGKVVLKIDEGIGGR